MYIYLLILLERRTISHKLRLMCTQLFLNTLPFEIIVDKVLLQFFNKMITMEVEIYFLHKMFEFKVKHHPIKEDNILGI